MGWFTPKKISDNELGEYLPDGEAQLSEGNEYLEASTQPEAVKKCKEIAQEYDAVDSDVEQLESEKKWNCKFRFWS